MDTEKKGNAIEHQVEEQLNWHRGSRVDHAINKRQEAQG